MEKVIKPSTFLKFQAGWKIISNILFEIENYIQSISLTDAQNYKTLHLSIDLSQ